MSDTFLIANDIHKNLSRLFVDPLAIISYFFSGHSRELVDGHAQFMQGIKPAIGYNGDFGFRRNTPWLRQSPSPFGTASRSPAHVITVEPREKVPRSQTVRAK